MIFGILACLGLAVCIVGFVWARLAIGRERDDLRRALREEHRRAENWNVGSRR